MQLGMDVLKPFNRTQMDPPDPSPLSTNFAKATQQSHLAIPQFWLPMWSGGPNRLTRVP